ncbi:MAG: PfkB family carbohydrate kinase, partial [Kiritimatiellia bacterium]
CSKSSSIAIGAGDAFLAGFLFEMFRGAPLVDAARFALVMAAFAAESLQVRAEISEKQIRKRIAERFVNPTL